MKKNIILLVLLLLPVCLYGQAEEYQVTVSSVSVPVRVTQGNSFIYDLNINDFELYENGILQKLNALYLVKNTGLARSEAGQNYNPLLARHFYFLFQISEYDPRFKETIDYFFNSVLQPGDTLTLMTPMGNYNLSQQALKIKSKEKLSRDMQKVVRKDATIGSANYRSLIRDLSRIIRTISAVGGVEGQSNIYTGIDTDSLQTNFDGTNMGYLLAQYRAALDKLESLRVVEQNKLVRFARSLKRLPGQKQVYFFYEREFRPEISERIMSQMMQKYTDDQNIIGDLQDLFQFYQRHVALNVEQLQQVFADSSLLFNFIFINRDPGNPAGITMREQSEDIFSTFSDITRATGGTIDNSQNPAAAFKTAYEKSGDYYLLYYSPINKEEDADFRNIEVKLKQGDYDLAFRKGYYATSAQAEPVLAATAPQPDTASPPAIKEKPPDIDLNQLNDTGKSRLLRQILVRTADYCEAVKQAALDFICREKISDKQYVYRTGSKKRVAADDNVMDFGDLAGEKVLKLERTRRDNYEYDYQLIQKQGQPIEKRILLKEKGRTKRVENAELKIKYSAKNIIFGPVGFLSRYWQNYFDYEIEGQEQLEDKRTIIIKAVPTKNNRDNQNIARIWINEHDFSVIQIAWEPQSIQGADETTMETERGELKRNVIWTVTYGYEKNGIKFPSRQFIQAIYESSTKDNYPLQEISYIYEEYKFFTVETAVKH